MYSAFGEIVSRTGTTENAFTYTGEQWDPNAGFYYLRARWMAPGTGRFIGVDPWDGDPQSPISLHKYLYCNANPIHFSDPTGFFGLIEAISTYSLVSILNSFQTSAGLSLATDVSGNVGTGDAGGALSFFRTAEAVVTGAAVVGAGIAATKFVFGAIKSGALAKIAGRISAALKRGPVRNAMTGQPDELVVGFRGSLVRGESWTGRPYSPTESDVDAFIVSDELKAAFGSKPNFEALRKRYPDLYAYTLLSAHQKYTICLI